MLLESEEHKVLVIHYEIVELETYQKELKEIYEDKPL